jgi:hypothetical protein
MSQNSDVGLSRKQRVFVALETTPGTLVFPNATTDFIRPAGNAVMNQNPAFADSEELQDTLDILDQFQNATPPGDWTIKMYVRPSGTVGSAPQGANLFKALQGSINAATTASISSLLSSSAATAVLKGIAGGILSQVGVVTVGTEKIHYSGLTQTYGATTATLTGLVRGYAGSTAAEQAVDTLVTLSSIYYRQALTSPSLSIWVETDHFVQAMMGCAINQAAIEITNEGGVAIAFTGQGMKMKWAGTSAMAVQAATSATQIQVDNAKLFCTEMYLYNETKASGKFLINASNATTNILRLGSAIASTWATDDVIKGYLPTGTLIGDPLEARDSAAYLNSTLTKIKRCTFTIAVPKQFLIDEIGTEYPEDYLENIRNITSNLGLYFRKADAAKFKDGYDANEETVKLTFGETAGSIMEMVMKKCRLQVPTINFAPPAIELNIPITALGTVGEDSLEIVFR